MPAPDHVMTTMTVLAWRDYDPAASQLPGMSLGRIPMTLDSGHFAQELWDLGARRVALPGWIDLASPADPGRTDSGDTAPERAVTALCLVRDLTALAVLVDWRLRLGVGRTDPAGPPGSSDLTGAQLSHLQPPAELRGGTDDAEELGRWRKEHYLGRLVWRQGPGFVQIRDRRWGDLRRFTVNDPDYIAAVHQLSAGAWADEIPAPVLAHLEREQLVGRVGDRVWLLAYRHRRWLQSGIMI